MEMNFSLNTLEKGFLAIPRTLFQSDFWTSFRFNPPQALQDLMAMVFYSDRDYCKRGQFNFTYASLQKRWKWSLRHVKKFLHDLIKSSFILINDSGNRKSPHQKTVTFLKMEDIYAHESLGEPEILAKACGIGLTKSVESLEPIIEQPAIVNNDGECKVGNGKSVDFYIKNKAFKKNNQTLQPVRWSLNQFFKSLNNFRNGESESSWIAWKKRLKNIIKLNKYDLDYLRIALDQIKIKKGIGHFKGYCIKAFEDNYFKDDYDRQLKIKGDCKKREQDQIEQHKQNIKEIEDNKKKQAIINSNYEKMALFASKSESNCVKIIDFVLKDNPIFENYFSTVSLLDDDGNINSKLKILLGGYMMDDRFIEVFEG